MLKAILLLSIVLVASAQKDTLAYQGRQAFVHLFEWKWTDIAAECERFLGPKGYAGVQVSPPNEHANIDSPYRPWWQRYQPVSYKLISRSGNEQEFRDMVSRCNAVGVRIYVDAIINHMGASAGTGTAGSSYNAGNRDFPSVPFSRNDFNDNKCRSASGDIENYNDVNQVRDCRLVGLPDLALHSEYVRNKIADYLNNLMDIGVAGFRLDASKHMWPGDLSAILSKVKNAREDVFGPNKRPFVFMEVIDMGNEPIKGSEYTGLGRVTEFKFGIHISNAVTKRNGQKLSYFKNFGQSWGMLQDYDAVPFIDNHDNQRGHGAGGEVVTFFRSRDYKIANAFMLAWPYGFPKVMSSYMFNKNNDAQGPPSNNGADTKDVIVNADDTCGNGWICEHRWRQIYNMNGFRNVASGEQVRNWWDNGNHQIAFSRGNKAFLAINNEDYAMDVTLQTGMAGGAYCDIISGNKINGSCTGKTINVNSDGTVKIYIKYFDEDPVIAFHAESKL